MLTACVAVSHGSVSGTVAPQVNPALVPRLEEGWEHTSTSILRLILVIEGAVSAQVTAVQPCIASCFISGPSYQQQVGSS